MTKKTSNDEKFVMNFFQKGNGNTQIASVNNFTAKDYMPDDEEESEETEELTEIEKAIQDIDRKSDMCAIRVTAPCGDNDICRYKASVPCAELDALVKKSKGE